MPMDLSSINQMLPIMARGPKNYDFLETQQARQNALRNRELEQKNELRDRELERDKEEYEEDRNYLKKQREQQMKKWSREDDLWEERVENDGFTNPKERTQYFDQVLPKLNSEGYSRARDWMINKDKTGIMMNTLPPVEAFKSPQDFDVWREGFLKQNQQAEKTEEFGYGQRRGLGTGKIYEVPVKPEKKEEEGEATEEFGYGQRRGKKSGTIYEVPVKPEKETSSKESVELKTSKYNAAKKLLDESYANLLGIDASEVHKRMDPAQSAAYRRILIIAERNLATMEPAQALDEAIKEYWKGKGKAKTQINKPLDEATAKDILKEAGGDKNKARTIAKERGYTF